MQDFTKSRFQKYIVGIICGLSIVLSSVSVPGCIPTKVSDQIVSVDSDVLLAIQSLSSAYSLFCTGNDSKLCKLNSVKYTQLVDRVIEAVNVFNQAVKAGTVGSTKEDMQAAYDSLYNFLEELNIIKNPNSQQPTVKSFSIGSSGNQVWEPVVVEHKRF